MATPESQKLQNAGAVRGLFHGFGFAFQGSIATWTFGLRFDSSFDGRLYDEVKSSGLELLICLVCFRLRHCVPAQLGGDIRGLTACLPKSGTVFTVCFGFDGSWKTGTLAA